MAKHFWIYTHNFTHSGAPLVMASIAHELAEAGWRDQLRIVSWGGLHDRRHSKLQHQLMAEGIKCHVLDPAQPPPRIKSGDRLLLNTVALPDAVIQESLTWIAKGILNRLDWYAHESDPEIWILNDETRRLIASTLKSGQLFLRVPSQNVCLTYQNWLEYRGKSIGVQTPRTEAFDRELILQSRPDSDFNDLKFALTGGVGFGNKGHLWFLRLIDLVLREIPNGSPGYRSIRISFLGLETGKFASMARHCIHYAESILQDAFEWKPACSRELLLSEMAQSNFLVNCSLKEAFSCVSSEGLALGLLLLRMRNGGFEEQLLPLQTGFDFGNPCPEIKNDQLELVQKLRDYSQISNSQLNSMSQFCIYYSQKFEQISYLDWLLSA